MKWIGRIGKRPHSILTSAELIAMRDGAAAQGLKCTICEGATAGLLHCKDCGWSRRFCEGHGPKDPLVEKLATLHLAVCQPVQGST